MALSNKRSLWTLALGAAGVMVLAGLGLPNALSARSRDKAAAPQAMPPPGRVRAEGRLVPEPGARVELGTDLAGRLLFVADEQAQVHRGQLVAEIDTSEQRPARAEARARKGEAEAQVTFLAQELARARRLAEQEVITQAALERAQQEHAVAVARCNAAKAEVERFAAILAKARVAAPIDGVVIARAVERGETVPVGAKLLTLADLKRTRIEAEVDEFDAPGMQLGDEAIITVEGRPAEHWQGRVVEVPPDVVPSRLRPQDPGRPSDTNVLIVKIALAEPSPLKLGQRVEVEIMRAALAAANGP